MHYAFTVTEIESLEKLKDVVPHIEVDKARVESPEVGVVDILEYKAGSLALVVPDDIKESNDVGATRKILKNLDLTLYLLLLHGL